MDTITGARQANFFTLTLQWGPFCQGLCEQSEKMLICDSVVYYPVYVLFKEDCQVFG